MFGLGLMEIIILFSLSVIIPLAVVFASVSGSQRRE
jgi:hypothetical protein